MKKNNKKGFTLAELLIVVAIIAVLVAIAIPVFGAQLDKSKLATATANVRSAYAEYVADCLSGEITEGTPPSPATPSVTGLQSYDAFTNANLQGCTVTVAATQITVKSPKNAQNIIPVELAGTT